MRTAVGSMMRAPLQGVKHCKLIGHSTGNVGVLVVSGGKAALEAELLKKQEIVKHS